MYSIHSEPLLEQIEVRMRHVVIDLVRGQHCLDVPHQLALL